MQGLNRLQALLKSVTAELFQHGPCTDCVIVLGKSAARPKERFHLRFNHAGREDSTREAGHGKLSSAASHPPDCSDTGCKEQSKLLRSAIREMLCQLADAESFVSSIMCVHLLVSWQGAETAAQAPRGFVVRPQGPFRQKRGLCVCAGVGRTVSGASVRPQQSTVADAGDEGLCIAAGGGAGAQGLDWCAPRQALWLRSAGRVQGWRAPA